MFRIFFVQSLEPNCFYHNTLRMTPPNWTYAWPVRGIAGVFATGSIRLEWARVARTLARWAGGTQAPEFAWTDRSFESGGESFPDSFLLKVDNRESAFSQTNVPAIGRCVTSQYRQAVVSAVRCVSNLRLGGLTWTRPWRPSFQARRAWAAEGADTRSCSSPTIVCSIPPAARRSRRSTYSNCSALAGGMCGRSADRCSTRPATDPSPGVWPISV